MAWIEIDSCEYAKHFPNPHACYLRSDFNQLNASRVDAVRFFAFDKAGVRLGITVGERGNLWFSPYSAPFGGFVCAKGVTIDEMDEAIAALPSFVSEAGKKIEVVLAPAFYSQTFLTKCISSMFRAGFAVKHVDLNYAFNYRDPRPYEKLLWNMARRNLKVASKLNFDYRMESTSEGIAACYEVIRKNRAFKGYPLKMSLEAFQKTSTIVPIEYSTLYLDGVPAAAAIVYRASPSVFQLIYWGDAPGFENARPMNMLAQKVYEHYRAEGISYLDIGPSSEDGIPNGGLCAFKESVGCEADLKYAFVFDGCPKEA